MTSYILLRMLDWSGSAPLSSQTAYLHLIRRLGACLLLLPFSRATGYHFSTKNFELTELTGISTVPETDGVDARQPQP